MKLKELESGDRVLNYEDIYLIPNYSEVKSRSDVDIGLKWGNWDFGCPAAPSNMSSVIDEKIAKYCSFNKLPYFYHRFGNVFEFVKIANEENWPFISISVGVKEDDKQLLNKISDAKLRVDSVLIDVAHAHSYLVSRMITHSRCLDFYTGAGNIWGDRNSIEFLQEDGADFIKIGLAKGAGCNTYNMTGFGSPMFSAAIEAGKWATVPVIIDGGVRNNGDIVKAIRGFLEYGKEVPLVMVGSLFAACIDAPGDDVYGKDYYELRHHISEWEKDILVRYPSKQIPQNILNYLSELKISARDAKPEKKRYYGSASKRNKQQSGQPVKHIEGFEVELPCNGMTFAEKIQEIKESLASSVSYAGGEDLSEIGNVKWVTVK